jgi:hypothetical protein
MKIVCRNPSLRRAAGPGFILLGLITLMLLPASARGQFCGGPGVSHFPPPGTAAVSRLNPAPQDRRLAGPGRETPVEDTGEPCTRQAPPKDLRPAADNLRDSARELASRPAPEGYQNLAVKPASSGWLPSRCPLPPASVFSLQTNFRKYLETWPTPGATATGDWPEYIPEDEDNLN